MITIGVDPAARRDAFAIAVIRDDKVLSVDAKTGILYRQMAPLLIGLVAHVDSQLTEDDVLGMGVDATGAGGELAERVDITIRTGRQARRIARPRARSIMFKGIVLTGGTAITANTSEPERRYEIKASRERIIGAFVLASHDRRLDLTGLPQEQREAVAREMKGFRTTTTAGGKTRLDHEDGGHDDILFALSIAWFMHEQLRAAQGGYIYKPTDIFETIITS